MMIPAQGVMVTTIDGRTPNARERAVACAAKIIYVSPEASPEIRQQALAYRARIEAVIEKAITDALADQRAELFRGI
jgi:hypothetical protein